MKLKLFCDVCGNDLYIDNQKSFLDSLSKDAELILSVKPCSFCKQDTESNILEIPITREDIEKIVEEVIQRKTRKKRNNV